MVETELFSDQTGLTRLETAHALGVSVKVVRIAETAAMRKIKAVLDSIQLGHDERLMVLDEVFASLAAISDHAKG